jgi:hypothetical protein
VREERLVGDGEAHLDGFDHHASRIVHPFSDVRSRERIGLVDRPGPPPRGARLLDVGAQHDLERIGHFALNAAQPSRVLQKRRVGPSGTRTDDHEHARIATRENISHFPTVAQDSRVALL